MMELICLGTTLREAKSAVVHPYAQVTLQPTAAHSAQ
jgi:hypothetical protein